MTEEPDNKDELLARYLLNELSQDENEKLEDEMTLDGALSERMRTVEMRLIDSYLLDEMSPAEKLRFQEGFLLLPENRLKVDDARDFQKGLRLLREERLGTRHAPRAPPWRERFAAFFHMPAPVFAALALLLAGGLGYLLFHRGDEVKGVDGNMNLTANPTPSPDSHAGSNLNGDPNNNLEEFIQPRKSPPASTNTPSRPEVARLEPPRQGTVEAAIRERSGLVARTTRGTERPQPQNVSVTKNSRFLNLNVTLEKTPYVGDGRPLLAAIFSGNYKKRIFPRGGYLPVTPKPAGQAAPPYTVSIKLPTSILKDGEIYYLELKINEQESPTFTGFKIEMIDPER